MTNENIESYNISNVNGKIFLICGEITVIENQPYTGEIRIPFSQIIEKNKNLRKTIFYIVNTTHTIGLNFNNNIISPSSDVPAEIKFSSLCILTIK